MTVWIGTSGWSYRHWRGSFYPQGLPPKRELEHASQIFQSLEVNRSFYSLLRPAACLSWVEQTPRGFVFSLKGSSFITHSKKLRDVARPLANFFASGPLALGSKLGPVVWQLPPNLAYDAARLEPFFALLPRDTDAASALAAQHDERLKHGAFLEARPKRKLRHAIEPRHESFRDPAFARLARKYRVAIVMADSASWPCIEETTTDFMYVRLHGGEQTYASAYGASALSRWAERIQAWQHGLHVEGAARISALPVKRARDVYVYFDNDLNAHAPKDALLLRSLVTGAAERATRTANSAKARTVRAGHGRRAAAARAR